MRKKNPLKISSARERGREGGREGGREREGGGRGGREGREGVVSKLEGNIKIPVANLPNGLELEQRMTKILEGITKQTKKLAQDQQQPLPQVSTYT